MQEQSTIPVGKVRRAARFAGTGVKVGGNYLKHYTKKVFNPDLDREELDRENVEDIYSTLSQLKGSALKVAQMLSVDHVLPPIYSQKFSEAQYRVPPLSYPLVIKTFQEFFNQSPAEMFDTFTRQAVNAASIGQVHQATKEGKLLAVKVQYPGVAESIDSDLRLVRPLAVQLLNLNDRELEPMIAEVRERLHEETNYNLEFERGDALSKACGHLNGLVFPVYYREWSARRILTMDWVAGQHLSEFNLNALSQEQRNQIGQNIFDFYHYQIHHLRRMHADPHPGNFLFREDGRVAVLDFGCVKQIPADFYTAYFNLFNLEVLNDDAKLVPALSAVNLLTPGDTPEEIAFFKDMFRDVIKLVMKPFHHDRFDFRNQAYFQEIAETSHRLMRTRQLRESKAVRGKGDALYIDRTYFGLFNLLHNIGAEVDIRQHGRVDQIPGAV